MKKSIVVIGIFIAFLITYLLQSNFFNWFTIAGIMPNLFVMFALFMGLFAGMKAGVGFAVFFGLFLDIVLGKNLGTNIIMLTIIAVLGVTLDKNFSKDSRLTIMLMVVASTIIFEIGSYIISIAVLKINVEVLQFIKVLAIETVFNALITIIIYPLVQILGYKVEDVFKEQKVLTRYF